MKDYVKIRISDSDKYTLISKSSAEELKGKKIHFYNKTAKFVYAGVYYKGGSVMLHRVVMKAKKGQIVDHINGDTLDNRLENLRFVTSTQNHYNHIEKPSSNTGFWGVTLAGNKYYRVRTSPAIKAYHGYTKTALLAALFRDDYVRKVTSIKNALNFPESIHEDDLRKFLIDTRGKIFTVYFVKRSDGRLRKITGRYGVSKYTNGKGLNYQPDDHDLFVVFDMKNKRYKMIDLKGVLCVVFNGIRYRVRREEIGDRELKTSHKAT